MKMVDKNLRKVLRWIIFTKTAKNISLLSYDPKYQVGAIIFKNDFSDIHAIGYNGNYSGGENSRDSDEKGQSGFIHAEINALIKAKMYNPGDYTMLITHNPCSNCAKCVVNSGIREVVFLENYSPDNGYKDIFKNSGVKVSTVKKMIKNIIDEYISPIKSPLGKYTNKTISPGIFKLREFFKEEMGVEGKQLEEIEEFFTIKISWNERENLVDLITENIMKLI